MSNGIRDSMHLFISLFVYLFILVDVTDKILCLSPPQIHVRVPPLNVIDGIWRWGWLRGIIRAS